MPQISVMIEAKPAPLARWKFAIAFVLITLAARLILAAMPKIEVR